MLIQLLFDRLFKLLKISHYNSEALFVSKFDAAQHFIPKIQCIA